MPDPHRRYALAAAMADQITAAVQRAMTPPKPCLAEWDRLRTRPEFDLSRLMPLPRDVNGKGVMTAASLEHWSSEFKKAQAMFEIQGYLAQPPMPVAGLAFKLAARARLVEATEFHVLRQRDGAVAVMPLPEDEPGQDSQVVVMAPISPNAPNTRACGSPRTDGYLAA